MELLEKSGISRQISYLTQGMDRIDQNMFKVRWEFASLKGDVLRLKLETIDR